MNIKKRVFIFLLVIGGALILDYGGMRWGELSKTVGKKSFVNIIDRSGIDKASLSMGVSWADIDGDGYLDLLILSGRDGTKLLRNNHNETFTDITRKSGIHEDSPPRAADYNGWRAGVFGDYDNDGCVDLYISVFAASESERSDKLYRS